MSTELQAPAPSRSPWQRFYGSAHRWRYRYWQKRQRQLPKPVISIGNLHWGGSGKTPLTAAVAAHLRDRGLQVTILSRGYGRQGKGTCIVSRGQGPCVDAARGGDEPVLLADLLPGVAVVVDGDRYAAGRHALEGLQPKPDVFVLDDGFSHLKLARDLDLLVFPAGDPFAGGRLAPAGRLREPLASASRADAVLLSGGDDPQAGRGLAKALATHGFRGPGFHVARRLLRPETTLQGAKLEPRAAALAVSAIARPETFVEAARRCGFDIVEALAFPDHHGYDDASLRKIVRTFRACRAEVVLITDKDRVKLDGRLDLPLAVLSLKAEPEAAFFPWLDKELAI